MIGFLIILALAVFAFISIDEKQRKTLKLMKECNQTNQELVDELKKLNRK
ncbi:hypothetical protein [Alkalihalobacillus sp. LMS39]|nr:hypothetical protein [Alkalihalobacillus sp. LMS39]UOE95204.1 hypothetical protein MM271_06170 [Alkalihalobacillus sp. LMS39]